MKPTFTIAICAFNASQRIHRALDALVGLNYSGSWNVLVVDNASTDGTAELVSAWQTRLPALRIIREATPGVGFARMRAMREAAGTHLCFVDDDNLLAEDYLEIAAAILGQHPEVGVIAGRSELLELAPPPSWFPVVASNYAVGDQYGQEGLMANPCSVWGAGTVLRGEAVKQLLATGFTPLLTGRLGRFQLAGEDAEICLALNLLGWRSYWCPQMTIRHAIEPARMTLPMLRRTAEGFGISAIALETYRAYFQPRRTRLVKHSDILFAAYICYRFALAVVRLPAGGTRDRANYWLALGLMKGFFLAGMRPSRILTAAFFGALRSPGRC